MKISKLFCMLIAGLAIISFTTVGMAEDHPKAEAPKAEASKAEASKEEHPKAEESEAESEVQIEYGAKPELKSGEKEAKAEENE
jgi:hypothetical protein